ncbi:hypothetical protein M8J76_001535 [Diaphorina citri]|nr:hypothetical protein M8J76_001535 [Diaphorina citri]
MANNQWKSFQSPSALLNSEASSIFDFKSMSLQGAGLNNFRSITGAGANNVGGGGSSGGLLGSSGGSGPFGNSSHAGYNHLNVSLFAAKNDLHGAGGNSLFSSSGYNSSSASVPPPMNYNMFGSNHNNNNSSNARFPPIGTFSASNPSAGGLGGGGGNMNPLSALSGGGSHNPLAGMNGVSPLSNGPAPDPVMSMFNGFDMGSSGAQHGALNSGSSASNAGSYNDPNSQTTRETGIIEKLLHSYGFIQCCERQARLFFHFSQFSGNIEHLKIGDPVEFEMTYDRRTGKPIASTVSKIAPEVVLSEERVTGTVTTEIRAEGSTVGDTQGRISYENRGECFFLPYTKDDVEGNVTLRSGDKVSFQIATNPRGNLGASHVRLENPVHPVKYQGVVCSMKESFGFIERADVVKEIFFHFSESKPSTEEQLQLGDDVEFNIQTRNGKEVAVNLSLLPRGSVVFEDITEDIVKGQVLKPLERGLPRHPNTDPLPGRIRYRAPDHSEVEIPFGEKDQRGDFTLKHGDWVQFQVATDRRDSLRRATRISLLHESFLVSGERREQGVVTSLSPSEGYGWVRSAEREPRLAFKLGEVLDRSERELKDTTLSAGGARGQTQYSAIRMIRLSPGTVQFEAIIERNVLGFVTKEASFSWNNRSPANMSPSGQDKSQESGVIAYNNVDGAFTKSIIYFTKDCCDPKSIPSLGDKVEFNVCQVKSNKQLVAVEIRKLDLVPAASQQQNQQQQYNTNNMMPQVSSASAPSYKFYGNTDKLKLASDNMGNGLSPSNGNSAYLTANGGNVATSGSNGTGQGFGTLAQGFIAALKDGFGFIETDKHDREVFFHFSNFDGDVNSLELGLEVEYTLGSRNSTGGSCLSAENVRPLPKGTIPHQASVSSDAPVYEGIVMRPLRSVNPDQAQYSGLVKEGTPDDEGKEYEFGILSLVHKRDLLQIGDPVQFQVDSNNRAANLVAVRQKFKSTVNAIKGLFGFLNYELEEGKKLFFHTSEVKDGASLGPGDQVEFVLVTNHRTGKSSACNVVKINENQVRPERLISRLRTTSLEDNGPKMTVTRQPRGPDGSRGFGMALRAKHTPGVV